MAACKDTRYVLDKLAWMRTEGIWPNGQRYLWTDAFGVVLLISLHAASGERRYLDQAEWVVAEVDRVPGNGNTGHRGQALRRCECRGGAQCGFMRFPSLAGTFLTTGEREWNSFARYTIVLSCRTVASSGR